MVGTPRRDLDTARAAFDLLDTAPSKSDDAAAAKALSRNAHCSQKEEGHRSFPEISKLCMEGLFLGEIVALGLTCGGYGLGLPARAVLALTFGVIVSLALSYGSYTYHRVVAEVQFYSRERKREFWECENYLEGEVKEMVELYTSRGMPKDEAEAVIKSMSKYTDFFVDVMMKEELSLIPSDEEAPPFTQGLYASLSCFASGIIPVLPIIFSVSAAIVVPLQIGLYLLLVAISAALQAHVQHQPVAQTLWKSFSGAAFVCVASYTLCSVYADYVKHLLCP